MTEEDFEEAEKGGFLDIIIDLLKVPYVASPANAFNVSMLSSSNSISSASSIVRVL